MRPFDIERGFKSPIRVIFKMRPLRVIDAKICSRKVELLIEDRQVVFDGRTAKGINDGDFLAEPRICELIEYVSILDLGRSVAACISWVCSVSEVNWWVDILDFSDIRACCRS